MLYFLPLPTHANDGDTLLRFSMQVGSIMYVLFIVFFLVINANVRRMLLSGISFFNSVRIFVYIKSSF